MRFRRDFVQRRLARRFGPAGKEPCPPLSGPGVSWPEDLEGLMAASDPERALAEHVCRLLDKEKQEAALAGVREALAAAETFTGALMGDARRGPSSRYHAWPSLRVPMPVVHDKLVHVIRPKRDLASLAMGPVEHRRRRDGFKLTDPRMTPREVLAEVHYCIFCHDRDKDSCSKGLPAGDRRLQHESPRHPAGRGVRSTRRSPKRTSCRAAGRFAGRARAHHASTTRCCPGTGHRICNDCMKACIYQKQDPVNIPQIETRHPDRRARASVRLRDLEPADALESAERQAPVRAPLQRRERPGRRDWARPATRWPTISRTKGSAWSGSTD